MSRTPDQIGELIAAFRMPDRSRYPELESYTRDQLYEECYGGGGLYLAARMVRTMHLQPNDVVLDLGCGKGTTSLFLAQHFGVTVIALDLWTSATFLHQKFAAHGCRHRIAPLQLDVTQKLPFGEDYFDAVFCMNSFSFYGGDVAFLRHLLRRFQGKKRAKIKEEKEQFGQTVWEGQEDG